MEKFIKVFFSFFNKKMTEEQQVRSLDVLVIDDEAIVGMLLGRIIEDEGDKATITYNGQKAIEEYVRRRNQGGPFDLVFTDLNMRRVSGVDVTRAVKKLSPKTPVYVITGNEANEEYERLSIELGELKPEGIIEKPFQDQDIIDILNQIRIQKYSPKNPLEYQQPTQL